MDFTPANELERVLMQALQDPVARPRFYQLLLESPLFVIAPRKPDRPGTRTENPVLDLVIWTDGRDPIVPVFTSFRLLRQTVRQIRPDRDYYPLRVPGRVLLGVLIRGTNLPVLNPVSPIMKTLSLAEIRDLLSGKKFQPTKIENVRKEHGTFLGPPVDYPHALADTLKRFLVTRPEVSAAYLAQYQDPASGELPRVVVAVSIQGKIDPVMQAMGMIADDVMPNRMVGFTVFGRGSSMDEYFASIQPFYQRPEKKSIFKRMFGG